MAGTWLISLLERWVATVTRRPWLTLWLLSIVTVFLGWVAIDRFEMNSNLSDLIRQEAPWRDDFNAYQDRFPDLVATAVVVVSGMSFQAVEEMTTRVESGLHEQDTFFRAISAPQNDPFFRRHALLYLDPEELDDMADRLAEAQPMLTAVAQDPSLRGILRLVADGVENEPGAGFATVVRLLCESAEAVVAGRDPSVSWTDEFFEVNELQHRLILLKGQSNFGESLPNSEIMSRLRSVVAGISPVEGVTVRITGEIALAHEEIEATLSGVRVAGWVAVLLLIAVLILGVRSAKIIVATFFLLLLGVIWTSAYAMVAVGEYNTLSIVFLVMFFGLGVDFSLHYSLRYQEAINAGGKVVDALAATTRSVGGAIAICTITTALGFMGFFPTDYKGLADLGVISAGGMFIAAFLTFTLLPALYSVVGSIRPHVVDLPTGDRLVSYLIRHRGPVLGGLGVAGVLAAMLATNAHFDYSVLALKNPASESMRTLRDLQAADVATDYALTIMSTDEVDDEALSALATVDSVTSPWDYVPDDQQDKLFVLEDLQALLWSALEPARMSDAPSAGELASVLAELARALDVVQATPELERLRAVLSELQERSPQTLLIWQHGVISNLLDELEWLREALYVQSIQFDDLPLSVRARLVSDHGDYLTVVTPANDVSEVEALSEFVESVRRIVPVATGRPVIEWGVGDIVIGSFRQALVFATVSILVVLFLTFRNLRDGLLILVPLGLAALFTLAVGVLLNMPLNMANILVLPLIFGLGVDNGIHVVDRFHRAGDVNNLMHSSTPRAVMLSTLTTIGTFSALMLSPHQGTASIGVLLSTAVALLLLFTVFVLPVLLSFLVEPEGS